MHLIEAESVEEGVDSTQRTDVFTERSVDKNRECHDYYKDGYLPAEQKSYYGTKSCIEKNKRDSSLQGTSRTDQLAEIRCRGAVFVPKKKGKQDDKEQ